MDRTPFWDAIAKGHSIPEASRLAGINPKTGYVWYRAEHPKQDEMKKVAKARKKAHHHFSQMPGKDPRDTKDFEDPIQLPELCEEAQEALRDFHYFSARYFGRVPTPWRLEAAQRTLELYRSPEKEFVVVNAPPGVGKSALFVHDIAAWLTCHDRAIRGVLGSWGLTSAQTFTRNLRRTLERAAPAPVGEDEITAQLAVEPTGILAKDFGRFKPLSSSEYWTATAFVVEQLDGRAVADKEPTWTAFGQGEILGWRVDMMIWDDLVTTKKLSSDAEQERLHRWWDNEVEKRLEPSGLIILQGQRLGANDLYRYCLDKLDVDDIEEIDGIDPDDPEMHVPRKYHHIKFKAHYEDRCDEDHTKDVEPYPDGCLIDPRRLSWREIRREQTNDPVYFETVYQQEDTSPDQVLVPMHWINGDGQYPGCWDPDRGGWEVPELQGRYITAITCDPSPAKHWAIQAWAYHPDSNQYFLLDLFRGQMTAEALLYYAHTGANVTSTTDYSGKLEEWRINYAQMGHPLRHVIVEKNVAQRFLLQYPHTHSWARKFNVKIHDHETSFHNKADKDYGIQMLRPLYEHGNIRLPGLQAHSPGLGHFSVRQNVIKLVKELTTYSLQFGALGTDDQVLANWFMTHKARKLRSSHDEDPKRLFSTLPRWLGGQGQEAA